MTTIEVEVELAPGWLPLSPVPGLLLAAALPDDAGRARAVLVVGMVHCPGLTDEEDADAMQQVTGQASQPSAQSSCEARWWWPETVAVVAAHAAPGATIDREQLAAAVRQTAVYAVDSTGNAIRPSSAGEASAELLGSTRTV